MQTETCANEECGNELDVFLANRYGNACTPVCAMRALRQERERQKTETTHDEEK